MVINTVSNKYSSKKNLGIHPLFIDHIIEKVIEHLCHDDDQNVRQNLLSARLVSRSWNRAASCQYRKFVPLTLCCNNVKKMNQFILLMKNSVLIPWTKFIIYFYPEGRPHQLDSHFSQQISYSALQLRHILSILGPSIHELEIQSSVNKRTKAYRFLISYLKNRKQDKFPTLPPQPVMNLSNLKNFKFSVPKTNSLFFRNLLIEMENLFQDILEKAHNLGKVDLFSLSYGDSEGLKSLRDITVENIPCSVRELGFTATDMTDENYATLSRRKLQLKKLVLKNDHYHSSSATLPELSEFLKSMTILDELVLDGGQLQTWPILQGFHLPNTNVVLNWRSNILFSELKSFQFVNELAIDFHKCNEFGQISLDLINSRFVHRNLKTLRLRQWLIDDPQILKAISEKFPNLRCFEVELNYGYHSLIETLFEQFTKLEKLVLLLGNNHNPWPEPGSVASVLTGLPAKLCQGMVDSTSSDGENSMERRVNLTNLTELKRLYLGILGGDIAQHITGVGVVTELFHQMKSLRVIQLSENDISLMNHHLHNKFETFCGLEKLLIHSS